MELSEYISSTISEVIEGVRRAGQNPDYAIAPTKLTLTDGSEHYLKEPSLIEFEIAVTISAAKKGGVNKILVVEDSKVSQQINKISFSVPVFYTASRESTE